MTFTSVAVQSFAMAFGTAKCIRCAPSKIFSPIHSSFVPPFSPFFFLFLLLLSFCIFFGSSAQLKRSSSAAFNLKFKFPVPEKRATNERNRREKKEKKEAKIPDIKTNLFICSQKLCAWCALCTHSHQFSVPVHVCLKPKQYTQRRPTISTMILQYSLMAVYVPYTSFIRQASLSLVLVLSLPLPRLLLLLPISLACVAVKLGGNEY